MSVEMLETHPIADDKAAELHAEILSATDNAEVADFIIQALMRGKTLMATNKQLSTTEAAKIIGVSRPFVCQLMDHGLLKFTLVGTKRRTTTKDVGDYLKKRDQATEEYVTNIANRGERLSAIAQNAVTLTEAEKQLLQDL